MITLREYRISALAHQLIRLNGKVLEARCRRGIFDVYIDTLLGIADDCDPQIPEMPNAFNVTSLPWDHNGLTPNEIELFITSRLRYSSGAFYKALK